MRITTNKKQMKRKNTKFYQVDFPVLLSHPFINKGQTILGRITATQQFSIVSSKERAVDSFDGYLELPPFELLRPDDLAPVRLGPLCISISRADFSPPPAFNPLPREDTSAKLNTAILANNIIKGSEGLAISLPLDGNIDFVANAILSFSCFLDKNNVLFASASGLVVSGYYSGMVIACCGMKTSTTPACRVSIAVVPNAATVTKTNATTLSIAGLSATATSSAGHTFATPPTVSVNMWRNGVRWPRMYTAAPPTITANGTITFPTFTMTSPVTAPPVGSGPPPFGPYVAGDIITITVTATDNKGDTGSNELYHIVK